MTSVPGDHLKICRGETTCCTEVMERKLSVESRQEFDTNLKNLLNPLANLLNKKNVKLNGECSLRGCVFRVYSNA